MALVLIGKDLFSEGSTTKIEDKEVPVIYIMMFFLGGGAESITRYPNIQGFRWKGPQDVSVIHSISSKIAPAPKQFSSFFHPEPSRLLSYLARWVRCLKPNSKSGICF